MGRKRDPGIEGGDLRGVPRRDGAIEDAGQRRGIQFHPAGDTRQVVCDGDTTQDVGDLEDGSGGCGNLGQVRGSHGHVRRGEGDGTTFECGDAGTTTDALVVDLQTLVQAGVLEEGRVEERLDEGRTGGVERTGRRFEVGGQVRGVAVTELASRRKRCRRRGR